MAKEDITLADKVLALSHDWRHITERSARASFDKVMRPEMLRLRKAVQQAERFKFDDDFTRRVVTMSSLMPNALLPVLAFANLPFEKVFFEFDQNVRVDQQAANGSSAPREDDLGVGGFLVERPIVDEPDFWTATYFTAGGYDKPNAYLGQSSYVFRRDRRILDEITDEEFRQASWAQHHWPLGWGYKGVPADEKEASAFYKLIGMGGTVPGTTIHKALKDAGLLNLEDHLRSAKHSAQEGRGDLRFLIMALALINIVPIKYVHKPSAGRYMHRLRNLVYLDHRIVSIHAGKQRIERIFERAVNAEAARKRRHKVRGFYRHLHRNQPNEKIVWIKEHERGDASLGYTTHEYHVD